MAKQLDERWLVAQGATEADREAVRNILRRRQEAIGQHKFHMEDGLVNLRLGDHLFSMRECAAPSSIEVYYEIFKEDDHFLHVDFSASGAEFVLDIGANEGFYALRVATANPKARIVSVEPNPFAFELLLKNIENNGLKNVIPINAAVSSDGRPVEMEFVRQINSIGGARLGDVDRPWLRPDVIEKMTVPSVTVADLLVRHSFPRIDLLKVDVEGMEDEIAGSLSLVAEKITRIVVERHSRELKELVTNKLAGLGFELVFEDDPECTKYYGDLYFMKKAHLPDASK